jgi:hypothetical protein
MPSAKTSDTKKVFAGITSAQEITSSSLTPRVMSRNSGMHESDALAYQHRFECAPGGPA